MYLFWFKPSILKTLVLATVSSIWQVRNVFCSYVSLLGCLNNLLNAQCCIYWKFINHFGVVLYLVVFSVLEAICFQSELQERLLISTG
jgi:hypothetical protein